MNRGTLVRNIFLSQWFLIRSASHLQRSRSETLDPGRWVRAISVTFSTKRRKPQIDFSNFFPMQRIFIIYSITFGQYMYLTREQWTWNFFPYMIERNTKCMTDLCLKLWNECTVSHYDRCVQDTDSLSRCLKLYVTIESQKKRCLWRWLIL